MQTDELRAELTELANEVAPFDGDLPAIRHRVARRRTVTASVAIVAATVVVVGAIALTRPSPKRVTVAHSVEKVGLAELPRFDVAVVLPDHATDQDVARVEQIIEGSDAVLRYAPLPLRELMYRIQSRTDADLAQLRALCADPSTPTFAIALSRADADAGQHLSEAIGANARLQPVGTRGKADMEVAMNLHASQAEILAVRVAIENDAGVASFKFFDHAAAYEEFKRLYADQPVLIEGASPERLAESFRITVRNDARPSDLVRRLQQLPGVDVVNSALAGVPAGTTADREFDLVCPSTSPAP